jgi:hypothetical protein
MKRELEKYRAAALEAAKAEASAWGEWSDYEHCARHGTLTMHDFRVLEAEHFWHFDPPLANGLTRVRVRIIGKHCRACFVRRRVDEQLAEQVASQK